MQVYVKLMPWIGFWENNSQNFWRSNKNELALALVLKPARFAI